MQVELCAIKWEGKSAKLRTEARRQARLRARRRGDDDAATEHRITDEAPDYDYNAALGDDAEDVIESDSTAPAVSPTMALAQRGMSQLPQIEPQQAPDTSNYRKSGLV